ncbi:MAG: hypothetical protein HY040_06180 [Planctomycetes bacterium]|nr:hypothetical protein [Planctomycetota bacterium]
MNAVDTNVFVYALDMDEPVKQAKAQDLFQRLATAGVPRFCRGRWLVNF